MTFAADELSVQNAMPTELYQISYTGNYWYYTSADRNIIVDGREYIALPITHPEIEPSIDAVKAGLPVTFPRAAGFAEVFRVGPPSEVVSFSLLVENALSPGDFIVAWRGRIINVEWQNNSAWFVATVENIFSSLQRPGLRRRYSITCPHALYGSQCRVSRDAFREISPILGVTGTAVVVQAAAGKPNNYYAGGFITYINSAGGNLEKRMIRQSAGDTGTLILASYPIGITAGELASIYAGCDHQVQTCDSKFNNVDNCGATPYIPKKNPFGGSTLY